MPAEGESGELLYEAQSPDEAALVSAARNFNFVFKSRTPKSITIIENKKKEEYELLQILGEEKKTVKQTDRPTYLDGLTSTHEN